MAVARVLFAVVVLLVPVPSWAQEAIGLQVRSVAHAYLGTRELMVSVVSSERITPYSLSVHLRTPDGTVKCLNEHTVWPGEGSADVSDLLCSPPGFVEWPELSAVQSATAEVTGETLFDRGSSYRCGQPSRTAVAMLFTCLRQGRR